MRAKVTTSTSHQLRETIRCRNNRSRLNGIYVRCVAILLVMVVLALPARAQESCSIGKGIPVGMQGLMCAAGAFHISLAGKTANGAGFFCDGQHDWTDKVWPELVPDTTYVMTANAGICVTSINFDVPPGYTLEIDGIEASTVDKTNGGLIFTGDGSWNVVLRKKCACGKPGAGEGGASQGSVVFHLGMGFLTNGQTAEQISIRQETLTPSIYTPAALIYSPPARSTAVDVVRDVNGSLRQVKAPQALADVVVINSSDYEVRYYDPANVGTKQNGIYTVSGQPYVTWKISNPSPSTTTKLRIAKLQGGITVDQNDYTWDPAIDLWTLGTGGTTPGTYSRVETKSVSYPTQTSRLETFIVKDGSGQIASKRTKTYLNYPWGWELVQEVEDPDAAALTKTYTYYEEPAQFPSQDTHYRKLKSITFPDGLWEKYDYDLVGNLHSVMRPWKDLSMATATEANSRLTIYGWGNSDNGVFGINAFPKILFDVEEKIAGITVTKLRYNRSQATLDPYSIAEAESRYSGSDENGVPTTLVTQTTTTRYHWSAPEFLAKRVSAVEYPDGRKDYYSYEKGNYVTNPDPSLNQFTVDSNGIAERVTIVHGTVSAPAGIAFKTTKDVTIHDQFGNSVYQETYAYNGADYERFAWTANTYDARGHLLLSRDSRGQLSTAVWNVDLKTSEIDSNGVETTYTYDPLGRVATKTKKGIAAGAYPAQPDILTTFGYDADGHTTSEVVSAGTPTLSLSSSRTYDRAGRVIKETDNAGLNKTYTYTNGGRTVTITRPGGANEINDQYLDGETKTVTGSAVVGRAFDYGVNADGTRYTQEFVGSGGLSSPRWSRTTIDWVGRTVFVTKPAFSGPDVVQATVYNNKNQKQSVSVSSNSIKLIADRLFEYDDMGNETRSGLDIDASGSLTLASTDRLKETDVSYQKVGSDWLLVTNWRDYFIDNNATPTTQTRTERLNNFSINGTDQTVSEISVTDLTGNSTKSTISIDRTAKRVTEITDTYDSDLNGATITVNGLLQSMSASTPQLPTTYTYDALGRQTSVTDPRKGTTTAIYNTTGQVLSTSDGFGTTSYEYYPGSQPGAGRLKSHTNPAGKKVYFNYSPRGEMVQTWGDTTYPIEYLFDPYGQTTEMHTFRNGKGWTMSLWPTATTGAADITRFVYQDATGLLIQKQDAVGKAIVYTYDEMGRVKTRTWARGITSTYSYDANTGDPAGVSYSDGTPATTLAYDRVGRKKTISDAAGVRARTFTNNGQLQAEQITTGILDSINVNIGYDSFLRRNSLQSSSGANVLSSQTYGYDSSSRLQTITSGSQTATYAYHPNSGLLNTTTFGTGTVTSRSYDTLGRLATIGTSTPASGVVAGYTYTYNNLYQRTRVTREDGSYWSYHYNDRGELADAKKYWADDTPYWGAQTEYSFDDVGNRISAKSGGNQLNQTRTSNFTTNSLNQYVQRTVPGALDVSGTANTAATVTVNDQSTARKGDYFYKELAVNNAAGPADQNVSIKGARQNFGAGGQDAVTEQGGNVLVPQAAETITYDFDGNLTSDSRWNYSWDAENRLISVESAVNVPPAAKKRLEFAYDYMSRRVQKKVYSWNVGTSTYQLQSTTKFVYDDWNLIAEINEVNSLLKSYVWGQDLSGKQNEAGGIGGLLLINDSTNVYQTGADGNGNIAIVISAASGLPSATYEYDGFGNTIRATGSYANSNTIRFSSKYVDLEIGLIYFGYRYYDPATGRFINRDPSWENDGPNIFTIVGNDPIDFVDPLGLRKLSREEGAVALRAGLPMLKNACDRGCAPGTGSCCKPKGCKLESATLVELLVQAWLRNHGLGPHNDSVRGSDTVGGYFCWDWARIFDDAASSRPFKCLGIQMGMALGPQDARDYSVYAVHYYLKVFACKKEEARYQVTFDDGFLDGATSAHEGYFPPLGGTYLDEQYPSPPPRGRTAPFTPTPRPPTRP